MQSEIQIKAQRINKRSGKFDHTQNRTVTLPPNDILIIDCWFTLLIPLTAERQNRLLAV